MSSTTRPLSPSSLLAQSAFDLRRARFSDLAAAARMCSRAFDDDVLFGRLIHPYRKSYPGDVDKYWYRRFVVDWWDPSHIFLVTTVPSAEYEDNGEEIVTGFAHWSRIAPSWRDNYKAGWGWAWWDPRRLLRPISRLFVRLLAWLSPNRAASRKDEFIVERSYNYLDHIWTGQRSECWYLECLAVHPDYQKQGQGRALVMMGLWQAQREGVACSVIAADGKEKFYQACGFDVGPVGRSGEGEGNPLKEVPGGLVFFKDKEGLVLPDRQFGSWMDGHGVFDWDEWKKGVETKSTDNQEPE
ncbi:uncharacterized protein A1O5_03001 [Cladophialophora psammophila CBS 110553]|uniref:N-acetyltransferase domain-containing protein n=1 Tax=Cladophialophora psammophila CBS 110553 TaxID=1182543 RepID=W9X8J0_9EURO|nr:uncharacterized protein A1O5_03001 [Cladophialophora psammophila CBS 110553]EXJ73241.1 hypothetical protein A1O5_03001 [Cladophialophora psammophila CBS 110553]